MDEMEEDGERPGVGRHLLGRHDDGVRRCTTSVITCSHGALISFPSCHSTQLPVLTI